MSQAPLVCHIGSELSSTTPPAIGVDANGGHPAPFAQELRFPLRDLNEVFAFVVERAQDTLRSLLPEHQIDVATTVVLGWAEERKRTTLRGLMTEMAFRNPKAFVSKCLRNAYARSRCKDPSSKKHVNADLDRRGQEKCEVENRDRAEHFGARARKALKILKHRDSLVHEWICLQCLHALSQEEAAARLGRKDGTLRQRLAKCITRNPGLRAIRNELFPNHRSSP